MFIGVDLAWRASPKTRTGLAAVDDTGRLVASSAVVNDDDIGAWLASLDGQVIIAAIDAPLIVPNDTGQRVCETLLGRAFGAYAAGPYPSNRTNPLFDPPRALVLARRFGWSVDPDHVPGRDAPGCIEVYPHPAMVGLFGLGERILYKKGPDRARGFVQLMGHYESVFELRLDDSSRWAELRAVVAAPKPGDLTRIEDELDAILCAHLAWLWQHRRDALQVYGSADEGYIVAPPPPTHPAVRTRRVRPPRPLRSVAFWATGEPAPYAGGSREQRWRAAVVAACPPDGSLVGERFAVEVEFVMPPPRTHNDRWDIDNLVKPVLDSLGSVLGRRTWNGPDQADDERVDRLTAAKRTAAPGEPTGATIRVRAL